MEENIGYKAYGKGLICRGKQYKENEIVEEEEAVICKKGIHYCLNPLDIFTYYPLVDSYCNLTEFTKVTPLDAEQKLLNGTDTKRCSKKVKIGSKLSLESFIESSLRYMFEESEKKEAEYISDGILSCVTNIKNNCDLATRSEYSPTLATTMNDSHIAIMDDDSETASIGNNSRIVTSGDYAHIATTGEFSFIASMGESSHIATTGSYSNIATTGEYSHIATTGCVLEIATTGDFSNIVTSADCSEIVINGNNSVVAITGDQTHVAINGRKCIGINVGDDGRIKGKKGTWITLAEHNDNFECVCVKSAQIDGIILKEDTWYKLKNGEFVECKIKETIEGEKQNEE